MLAGGGSGFTCDASGAHQVPLAGTAQSAAADLQRPNRCGGGGAESTAQEDISSIMHAPQIFIQDQK